MAGGITPNELLKQLLSSTANAKHQNLLKDLHQVCMAQHETSKDFRLGTIGKICEATGLFRARILYNSASANHRALIGAWQAFSGGGQAPSIPGRHEDERLVGIPDLALRSYVQTSLMELRRKTAEVTLLKSQLRIQVHQLQQPIAAAAPLPADEMKLNLNLNPSELEALEKAVDARFLEQEGWIEGRVGEIRNQHGRTLFGPGYVTAVRKVIKAFKGSTQLRSRR